MVTSNHGQIGWDVQIKRATRPHGVLPRCWRAISGKFVNRESFPTPRNILSFLTTSMFQKRLNTFLSTPRNCNFRPALLCTLFALVTTAVHAAQDFLTMAPFDELFALESKVPDAGPRAVVGDGVKAIGRATWSKRNDGSRFLWVSKSSIAKKCQHYDFLVPGVTPKNGDQLVLTMAPVFFERFILGYPKWINTILITFPMSVLITVTYHFKRALHVYYRCGCRLYVQEPELWKWREKGENPRWTKNYGILDAWNILELCFSLSFSNVYI